MLRVLKSAIIALFAATMWVGCKSSHSASTPSDGDSISQSIDERFKELSGSYNDWTSVNASVKLHLQHPKEMSISGRLYMTRNKSITLSLRFLGMEVMNLHITEDSIFATDKIHKYYMAEDLRALTAGFPLAVSDVQDLLLGRVFLLEHGTLKTGMKRYFDLSEMGSYMALAPKKSYRGVEYAFGIDSDNRLKALTVTRNNVTALQCVYDKWSASTAGITACDNQVSLSLDEIFLQASISSDWPDAKWSEDAPRMWKKPGGYKRIYGKALVEALTSSGK